MATNIKAHITGTVWKIEKHVGEAVGRRERGAHAVRVSCNLEG